MTLTQFDVHELLDAVRAGGDIDVIRSGVEFVLQALIDTEAAERIGATRYERTETRTTQRDGTRDRLLATKAGDVELKIPKLRTGSFFPSILERRRRVDQALYAVVMEAYVHGVTTRKVDDLVAALGGGERDLQERSLQDLRRPRRRDGRVPHPALRSRRVHLCVRGRHPFSRAASAARSYPVPWSSPPGSR